jgi:hypothetical protein
VLRLVKAPSSLLTLAKCPWSIFAVLVLTVPLWPAAAMTPSSVDHACANRPAFSRTENKVWRDVCKGREVNLNETENISAEFLTQVLTTEPFVSRVKTRGFVLRGGTVTGSLVLRNIKFDGPILHLGSKFLTLVDVSNSQFTGSLSFHGGSLPEGLLASHLVVAGSLHLGDSDDTVYDATRQASGAPIKFVRAPHARVDQDIIISGATIQSEIDISNSSIKGALTIMYVASERVNLSASEVGNQLIFYNCTLHPHEQELDGHSDLNLYSLRTKQSVLINRVQVRKDVFAEGVDISGDLILLGSTISSINARSARVSGSLSMGQNEGPPGLWTSWHGESVMDLTSARFGGFKAPEKLSVWPTHILFHNFSFDFFSPDFCGETTCPHSAEWYGSWLQRQAEPRKSYEPYGAIVKMLASQGQALEAQDLAVLGHDIERADALQHGEIVRYALLSIYKYSIGYGEKLYFACFWVMFFVIIGAVIFRRTEEARQYKMPYGLSYSFDMLLPIVHLREAHYKINLNGPPRYYFYFHKLVGWTLGLLLAAAVSGITK